MATGLYPPPRPLSVGEVLDLTFRIFRATLVSCLLYAAISVIVSQLPNIYNIMSGHPTRGFTLERDPVWWALYVVGWLAAFVFWSAILLRQYAIADGRRPQTRAELRRGMRLLPATLLIALLVGLAVGVWFVPAMPLLHASRATAVLILGLLSIPATWLGVALSCAGTALLLTDRGPLACLAHSWRLVSGNWWRLATVYTVGLILLLMLGVLSGVIGVIFALLMAHGDVALISAIATVVVVILSSIGTPLYTALALAVFGDLSVRREGIDLAQRIAAAH